MPTMGLIYCFILISSVTINTKADLRNISRLLMDASYLTSGNGLQRGFVASCFEKSCKTPWLDANANRIEAHGGGILHTLKDGRFYWYGEGTKHVSQVGYGYSVGVSCYSAASLHGPWNYEGLVFRQDDLPNSKDLPSRNMPFIIERPKVIYNSNQHTYVMWFHFDVAERLDPSSLTPWQRRKKLLYKYSYRRAGVATSLSPVGPFKFVHALLPNGEKSLDLQLFQEGSDAFVIRSVNNKFVGVSRLSVDYLNVVGSVVQLIKPALEAITVFRAPHDQCLYSLMSHLTGWDPNPMVLLRAQKNGVKCDQGCSLGDVNLEWVDLGNPTHDKTSFNAQPTFVIQTTDSHKQPYLVVMSDNWVRAGPQGLPDAGYIWLPLKLHRDGSLHLQYLANWSLDQPFAL